MPLQGYEPIGIIVGLTGVHRQLEVGRADVHSAGSNILFGVVASVLTHGHATASTNSRHHLRHPWRGRTHSLQVVARLTCLAADQTVAGNLCAACRLALRDCAMRTWPCGMPSSSSSITSHVEVNFRAVFGGVLRPPRGVSGRSSRRPRYAAANPARARLGVRLPARAYRLIRAIIAAADMRHICPAAPGLQLWL